MGFVRVLFTLFTVITFLYGILYAPENPEILYSNVFPYGNTVQQRDQSRGRENPRPQNRNPQGVSQRNVQTASNVSADEGYSNVTSYRGFVRTLVTLGTLITLLYGILYAPENPRPQNGNP